MACLLGCNNLCSKNSQRNFSCPWDTLSKIHLPSFYRGETSSTHSNVVLTMSQTGGQSNPSSNIFSFRACLKLKSLFKRKRSWKQIFFSASIDLTSCRAFYLKLPFKKLCCIWFHVMILWCISVFQSFLKKRRNQCLSFLCRVESTFLPQQHFLLPFVVHLYVIPSRHALILLQHPLVA